MSNLANIFQEGKTPDLGLLLIVAAGLANDGKGIELSTAAVESLDISTKDLCIELNKDGNIRVWLAAEKEVEDLKEAREFKEFKDDEEVSVHNKSDEKMDECVHTDCGECGKCFDPADVTSEAEVKGGN